MTISTYAHGAIFWLGEVKTSKNDQLYRSAMISSNNQAISLLLFGDDVSLLEKADCLAAEGRLEASTRNNKEGNVEASLSIVASWWRPTGKAGVRIRAKAAKDVTEPTHAPQTAVSNGLNDEIPGW